MSIGWKYKSHALFPFLKDTITASSIYSAKPTETTAFLKVEKPSSHQYPHPVSPVSPASPNEPGSTSQTPKMSPDTLSLAGKVAIITGSGRENGIGAAIAVALARNGAAVTINHVSDSSAPRAEAIAQKIREEGGKAIVIQASVDEAGAKRLVDGTIQAFGGIDILGEYHFSFWFGKRMSDMYADVLTMMGKFSQQRGNRH